MKKALKIAAWTLLVLFVLFALLLWGFIEVMSPDPHEYLTTPGPAGQVAHLERPGGSMEPIYYSVKVDRGLKGACTAAKLEGYEAERWVRLAWDGPALVVRYDLPRNPEAKGLAPSMPAEDGCGELQVRLVADASLIPPEPAQSLTPELAAEFEKTCGLPAGTLTGATPIADVRQAAPKIACAVQEGRKRGVTVGFISNPVDPNAQTH